MSSFFAIALTVPSQAQEAPRPFVDEIRLGILAHDVPNLWSGFHLETSRPDLNGEMIFSPSALFLGGTVRPVLGGSWNSDHGTSKVYFDARWESNTGPGIFFGLGLGAAIHDGYIGPTSMDHKALGSRVLFHIPAEIGYRFENGQSLSLYFEHDSNAHLRRYNEGLDDLGVRYGYKF